MQPGAAALRALIGVLALSAAEIDAETDAFYDALFVETAPPAALPAIAALVGAPLLRPMPDEADGSQRALIANTIRYRRGKGTPRVIEALAADVTGLGAVVVQYFQRLARLNHLLDVRTDRPGTADLRPGETASRAGTAFDVLPRLVDLRSVMPAHTGRPAGRHAATSVGVHLLRPVVPTFPAPTGATVPVEAMAGAPRARPWPVGETEVPGYFQLSQQPGEVLRLFNPDRRADGAGGRAVPTDLPDRLRRLPLHQETEELRRAALEHRAPRLPERPWFDEKGQPFAIYLQRDGDTTFRRVPPAEIRIVNLESPPTANGRPAESVSYTWFEPGESAPINKSGTHPISCAFDPVTGRLITPAPSGGAVEVTEVRIAYATGLCRAIGAGAQDRNDPDVPFDIRNGGGPKDLVWVVDPTKPPSGSTETTGKVVPTLAAALAAVDAEGAGRRSFIVLVRCDHEGGTSPSTPLDVWLPPESEVSIVAADWRIPPSGAGAVTDAAHRGHLVRRDRRFTIDAPLRVRRRPGAKGLRPGRLVLDGLELTQGLELMANAVASLDLRFVTLRARALNGAALTATGMLLSVDILIDRSICGPVRFGHRVAPGQRQTAHRGRHRHDSRREPGCGGGAGARLHILQRHGPRSIVHALTLGDEHDLHRAGRPSLAASRAACATASCHSAPPCRGRFVASQISRWPRQATQREPHSPTTKRRRYVSPWNRCSWIQPLTSRRWPCCTSCARTRS